MRLGASQLCSGLGGLFWVCLWIATLVGAEVIYVDESALGLSSGDSWDEAYRSLQDALDRIGRTDAPVEGMEIWVAEGVYYPDEGNGRDNDDREATFRLYNGTTIYGGFGGEETTIEARDPSKYVTVLSGDITQSNWEENGNVVGEDPEEGLNSYHVVTAQNIDESAVLDGVTITGGVADGIGHLEGGGLLVVSGSPTLRNCIFLGNVAQVRGGGVSLAPGASTTAISGCRFLSNRAAFGGALFSGVAEQVLVSCQLAGNSAESQGGAVYVGDTMTLINCVVSGNFAAISGGGLYAGQHSVRFQNCTLAGNRAGGSADADAVWGNPLVRFENCVVGRERVFLFEGNPSVSGGAQFQSCLVSGSGGSAAWNTDYGVDQGGNVAEKMFTPTFVRSVDPEAPTISGDLQLWAGSSAVDAGSEALLPADTADLDGDRDVSEKLSLDVCGQRRTIGGALDMGAFELGGPGLVRTIGDLSYSANASHQAGAVDLADVFGSGAKSYSLVSVVPDGVVVPTLHADGALDLLIVPDVVGLAEVTVSAMDEEGDFTKTSFKVRVETPVCFVSAHADGTGSGLSWANAMTSLQDALAAVSERQAIWIAEGVYYPDEGRLVEAEDRGASFNLREHVAIYGGFRGEESELAQRNPSVYRTVLSGDIDQNDDNNSIAEWTTQLEGSNSYHVVTAVGVGPSAVMDGVTITAGLASGVEDEENVGGGLYVTDGTPTIRNCVFSGNKATSKGGAVYGRSVAPRQGWSSVAPQVIQRCVFEGNQSGSGGAMYSNWGSLELENCSFAGNFAVSRGEGAGGGALATGGVSFERVSVRGCAFWGNATNGRGGGVRLGGGMHFTRSPGFRSCSFSGNRAEVSGGACYLDEGRGARFTNCSLATPSSVVSVAVFPEVSFLSCLVRGSGGSTGWDTNLGIDMGNNIDVEPFLVLPVMPGDAPTKAGDLRLMAESPLVDHSGVALADALSSDLEGNPRISGRRLDIGAYELQDEVSYDEVYVGPVTLVSDLGQVHLDRGDLVRRLGDQEGEVLSYGEEVFSTIQEAVDAVNPGGVVQVANGNYDEQIEIENDVELQGSSESVLTGLLDVKNGDVILRNFEFGEGNRAVVSRSPGIVDILNCRFNGSAVFHEGSGRVLIQDCVIRDCLQGSAAVESRGMLLVLRRSQIIENGEVGVVSSGRAEISECDISRNRGDFQRGGGIVNTGEMMISNSTISWNDALWGAGGGIVNRGKLTVVGSTISENSADRSISSVGGGIYNDGVLTVAHSTIANNRGGGIVNVVPFSGTLLEYQSLTLAGMWPHFHSPDEEPRRAMVSNTLLIGNTVSVWFGGFERTGTVAIDVIGGGLMESDGSNFIGHADSDFPIDLSYTGAMDAVIGPLADLSGFFVAGRSAIDAGRLLEASELIVDAVIGPLADNGGLTLTHALVAGSPAIDAGRLLEASERMDQRGGARVVGNGVDIGSVEYGGGENGLSYSEWASAFLLDAQDTSFSGDADEDGLSNGFEYVFGNDQLAMGLTGNPMAVELSIGLVTEGSQATWVLEKSESLTEFVEVYRREGDLETIAPGYTSERSSTFPLSWRLVEEGAPELEACFYRLKVLEP